MKVAIFASGSGSNAEAIVRYLHHEHPEKGIRVACIIANKPYAYVLERAKMLDIPARYMTPSELRDEEQLLPLLADFGVEYIILAGYLALIPPFLLKTFPQRIVNIHPALLPKHGGKGMYGMHVHEAVKAAGETETGITIHIIDEEYDKGTTLFQARTAVVSSDTPEEIAQKVHLLEHRYFPEVISRWILGEPQTLD
ncbi:phosphoribosylglycinamide formyltransferase [Porphyromonas sp.]|uniref:phosphoribosylglycinamide formyltransferase n=1 Tax=Porphyromonas sp. TaxID=1924944 RepID=UPI0026DAECB2|nr:phosphoribosylglycinamide formyltransferase [Porphyromonas sp.]MDO4771905.1 phosphoribosylglycinamide formyltransferase [Porphyromonas sp.]